VSEPETGRLIARLRAEHHLTQSELADLLQVTHQAVSKWERGESLPDVALLLPLAEVLGTTADQLLRGETATGAARRPQWRFRHAPVPAAPDVPLPELPRDPAPPRSAPRWEQVIAIAPFIKRERLWQLLEDVGFSAVSWEALVELAPFLPQERLIDLVDQVSGAPPKLEAIEELAPFLDPATLSRLVEQIDPLDPNGGWEAVEALAPFLPSEQLEALMVRALNHEPS